VDVVAQFSESIDLLYLDADGSGTQGKGIYLDILERAYARIPDGGIVIAHNSINCAGQLAAYLEYVRDPANLSASMNMFIDGEGVEVTRK